MAESVSLEGLVKTPIRSADTIVLYSDEGTHPPFDRAGAEARSMPPDLGSNSTANAKVSAIVRAARMRKPASNVAKDPLSAAVHAHDPDLARTVRARIEAVDWARAFEDLDARGNVVIEHLLAFSECDDVAARYVDDAEFRSRVVMESHGFGRGEYKYFRYPLPPLIAELRTALYPHLVPVANRWNEAMRIDTRYPDAHVDYLTRCHDAGQTQPTPLLLRYGAGDYNCLHQDLYGDHVFPLQVAILLSRPVHDFTGGEFVITEQRPRMQSRPEVVHLDRGDAVIFAVRHRPVQGTRGTYRVNLRHGVSRLRSGQRLTLGIIFHDAT
jgi:hypothetical protein